MKTQHKSQVKQTKFTNDKNHLSEAERN